MRISIGQHGVLAKDLPTLCCNDVIHAGVEIEIYGQHSPKRVMIQELPERPFLHCGHSFRPIDGDLEAFGQRLRSGPQLGTLGDIERDLPKACPVHRVKASKIWFVVEEGEEWKQ